MILGRGRGRGTQVKGIILSDIRDRATLPSLHPPMPSLAPLSLRPLELLLDKACAS